MKHVFIIGSKGIPAKYGGFETFVDQLTSRKNNSHIQYYVSCLADNNQVFTYGKTHCFNVKVPNIGSAKAILYDILSLKRVIKYIKENQLKDCIVYILACRIGPFTSHYKKILRNLNAKLYINPDGHEWLRSKWSKPVRRYWKFSERLMVKNADLLICDSKGIEKYIVKEYVGYNPKTTFIAYGSDVNPPSIADDDPKILDWFSSHHLNPQEYFLIVGRFVPENNYELMIKEFMKSKTTKNLVIISNVKKNDFYNYLLESTRFNNDLRIKFVGTVYDKELLKKIREKAFAYFHGHEVGGTNPSLLEALSSTPVNLLLNVEFNKEVGQDGALYFSKEQGHLNDLISTVDNMSIGEIQGLQIKAKQIIIDNYSWKKIINDYESLFLENNQNKL